MIDERFKAEYRELRAADLVNRCTARPMPFGYTVNPYRGCGTGCVYCYARYTHDFLGHNDPREFERTIYASRRSSSSPAGAARIGRTRGPDHPGSSR